MERLNEAQVERRVCARRKALAARARAGAGQKAMRGGTPKGVSDQWMRNALASGSIVAPRKVGKDRRLPDDFRPLGMAWAVLVALGLVALVVAAIVK